MSEQGQTNDAARIAEIRERIETDFYGKFYAEDVCYLLARVERREGEADALRAALQELYDASMEASRRIPIASEDWHHDLFEAAGYAFAVLHRERQP